ncbi:ATP-dependent helicase HrpB [Ilumatobacter nonamiensis]|uniref:ATP-dependent helicase HrpB n=1 Tax=Ilumatobacter nonamiensis TaxID=467093 RepID=UPI00034AD472|nr:ATP-dependent helicase HrpB [Ilumatobacter nonamiensis]
MTSDAPGNRRPLPDLPVLDALLAVEAALTEQRRVVLVAPPGAGKTTVVPIALLDAEWLGDQRIVMLEPRRLATRAAAQRMAALTGTRVGDLVGYQTRDERHIGPDTRIEVVTEGILTRRLQRDPELPGVGAIIFDEVHERNLPTDVGLALTLDVAGSIRPELRILAMSATPDTEGLVRVLDAPVIVSEGRTFDIEMTWLPRSPAASGRRGGGRKQRGPRRPGPQDRIEPAMTAAIVQALSEHEGDVLAFLPGIGEIQRTQEQLGRVLGDGVDVLPLAGALSQDEQDRALQPSPPGRRRVVLSTDIAETSLTVDGVRIVVDSGLAREPRFDARTGMTRLTTVSTSRASAEQRAGRAGRTEPGAAYRLWSKLEHGTRARHRTPEILQADLAGLALELAAWGIGNDRDRPTGDLVFIDPPPIGAMRQARDLLVDLHAIDADRGALTPLGRDMLALPVHPRLARMVAIERSPLACVVATLVDERDVFRGRPDELPVDLALRVAVISGAAGHDRADRGAVHRLRDRARELARRVGIDFDRQRIDHDRTGAVLMLAFPDRLAGRRRPGQYTMRGGSGAFIRDTDPLAQEPFVVAADLDGKADRARIRLAAAVDVDDVIASSGDDIKEQRTLSWNTDRDELVETVERRLGAIRLGSQDRRPEPGDETTDALMRRVRDTRLAVLGWSASAARLRERVEFLHRNVGDPWPDWSVDALVASVDEWLAPYLPGASGRRDLDSLDVAMVLRSQLPWPEGGDLERLVPDTLELPTGRSVPVDYSGEAPTASVRVQDLFGVTVHPTAGGIPIRLELLSPADRPIQVTADLPGFWSGTWTEVKKEMAGRYPKHRWPDDPASAPPRRMKDR